MISVLAVTQWSFGFYLRLSATHLKQYIYMYFCQVSHCQGLPESVVWRKVQCQIVISRLYHYSPVPYKLKVFGVFRV